MLAPHAAVAIENARLLERSRELNIVEERNRLARELHDAVSQKLFGLVLNAEAASTLLARDPAAAADQVARLGELAQEALQNALRHSGAHHVAVRLHDGVLEVSDDGAGFDPADPALRSRRLGLTSMEERARRLAGRLEIESAPGAGTMLRLHA